MKKKPQITIQLKTRLLPVLMAAAVLMQLLDPYKIWMILIAGLGLLWGISYWWARSLAHGLRLTREMRFGWAQVGDHLEERFTLEDDHWLPALWVEVEDHSNMPGYSPSRATGVEGTSHNTWRTHGICNRRGIYNLGPTSILSGDPFGIYYVRQDDPASTSLTVMPPIVPLPTIEVAPGGRSGEGRPRTNAPERIVSAGSVREYEPGDSLHWIHWKTTARRDQPFVKVFDGTPAGDWWIFLDMDRKVQIGEGWDSTEEHGVILAASLADRGFRMRRAVGLVSNTKEPVWLPPLEGSRSYRRYEILRALALAQLGEVSLEELLVRTRPDIGKYNSLIIITASIETGWIQALIPLIWKGVVPTVLLLDPASFGGNPGKNSAYSTLAGLGISRYLISKELLNRPEARPGHEGEWEWKVTPMGRAIPIRQPSNTAWKTLS